MYLSTTCNHLWHLFTFWLQSNSKDSRWTSLTFDWETIQAGVPQGSILGTLFFLIYINDLRNNLNSNVKLFADDTSIFSEIWDLVETANVLNNDLRKIRKWVVQWKMVFNPDQIKQAQEATFFRKSHSPKHPDLYFDSIVVEKLINQKYLGIKLDERRNFRGHLKANFLLLIKELGCWKIEKLSSMPLLSNSFIKCLYYLF